MYTISAPEELPHKSEEKLNLLIPIAPKMARFYGGKFNPNRPLAFLEDVMKARNIIFANDENGEPIGLLAYNPHIPGQLESQALYDRLSLEKLPPNLLPDLSAESKNKVERVLEDIRKYYVGIDLMDKAIHPDFRSKSLSNDLLLAASTHMQKEGRFYMGNIQPINSVIPRTHLGGATTWGGEILRPDLTLPEGLSSDELKTVNLILAHAFAAEHYPEALEAASGEDFDRNAIMHTHAWPKLAKADNFDFASNNLSIPYVAKAQTRILEAQNQFKKPYSSVAVTLIGRNN